MAFKASNSEQSSMWQEPYRWLAISAIFDVILSATILPFFIIAIYDEYTYMTGSKSGIGPAYDRPSLTWKINQFWPTLLTMILCGLGGSFLLARKKRIGVVLSLAGLAILAAFVFVMIESSASGTLVNRMRLAIPGLIVISPIAILCFMHVVGLKKVR